MITLPGDKSLSHRALMLASLAEGNCIITNLSTGQDVASTAACLSQCGIDIKDEGAATVITGAGGLFKSPTQPLNAGNSGTTARLLAGLLAGRDIEATIIGDDSLSQRPMMRVALPLSEMGANITLSPADTLPIEIGKADLNGITYKSPIASAQVKSAILLAALSTSDRVEISEPNQSRDHTERMLQHLGIPLQIDGTTIRLEQGSRSIPPFDFAIPGDPSSAAFLIAVAVLGHDTHIHIDNLLLNPTRLGFFNAIREMGAITDWETMQFRMGEPVGRLVAKSSKLKGITLTAQQIPSLIDEIPILAVLATQAEGTTLITGAQELRFKESDRIEALVWNLSRMGAKIEALKDGLRIEGSTPLHGSNCRTYGDHRIAMACRIAGSIATGSTTIDLPDVAAISFPEFDALLEQTAQ